MSKNSTASKIIHTYIVFQMVAILALTLILGIVTYIKGNPYLGIFYMGLCILFTGLSWKYGLANNQIGTLERSGSHFLAISNWFIGPLLIAGISFWTGNLLWGYLFIGFFVFSGFLYWFYGKDYFEVA